jgi:hypothetical protein
MNRLIQELLVPGLVIGLVAVAGQTMAQQTADQDIHIVDQDGVRINVQRMNWQEKDEDDVVDVSDLQAEDGKIIIIDKDGERREIDVSGARNIVVNKSVRSIIRDGEEQKQITGQAIIIGPDGKKQVIQLGEGLAGMGELGGVITALENAEEGQRLPQNFFFHRSGMAGKYMIGVSCQEVSDQLRAHLELTEGIGLVVTQEPTSKSPARDAGIQNHDVLMYAGEQELAIVDDLVDAVQQAGKEDREIALRLIRRGKEIELNVKPVERPSSGVGKALVLPEGKLEFQFERIGPGVLLQAEQSMPEGLLDRFEEIDDKIQARMEELEKLKEELREWKKKDRDDD